MQSIIFNGEEIARDAEGYMTSGEQWTEELAAKLAEIEGLALSEAHWLIINFLRDFYTEYEHTPAMRALVKALKLKFGAEIGNSAYLHQLFPEGPAKQASRIAGLPKPTRCM